jgi:predicted dienelactone hydrolase
MFGLTIEPLSETILSSACRWNRDRYGLRCLRLPGHRATGTPGNNSLEPYTAEGFLLWWLRARDLTTVIDMLLRDKEFAAAIDARRIGAIGFSLGGYTMFEIAGGRTDPARLQAFCRSADAEGCADPPEFPNLFARWNELEASSPAFRDAASQAGASYRDARTRAVFSIAPAAGPAFIPESLRQIAVPVAVFAGADDSLVPVRSNAQLLARLTPHASLTLLEGGINHYTFLATCTDAGRRGQPQLCGDAPGVDRDMVHQRTVDSAARVFAASLK